jgi:hypothetical protein
VSLTITCSKCAHTIKAKDELAGKKVMCPKCQTIIVIPAAAGKAGSSGVSLTRVPGRPWRERGVLAEPAPPAPSISPEQILATFHGQVVLPQVSMGHKIGTLLVLGVLFVLVLVYLAMLAGVGWLIYWLATHDIASSIPSAGALAMAGAVFALLCLLRPLLMPHKRSQKDYALQSAQAPALTELIAQIGKQLDAPPPTVQVECSPRLAIDRAGRTLTIGLGLVAGLTVQQFAGLIAGLVAQNRRGAPSGQTNLIRAINGWLWRSVYQEDRFERWITRVNLRPGFHLGRLVLPLRPLSFLARAALWVPMFIGNTVAAALVRRTEFDADLCSARLAGKQSFTENIERVKIIDYTWEGILPELSFLYKEQRLPDSLPHELAARLREITPELSTTLIQTVIKPSDEERVSAVTAEPAAGVMTCPLPASALWTDFGKLARDVSFDYYSAAFGAQYLKTALRQVD